MITEITSGVEVSINATYLAEKSQPEYLQFVFTYHVFIKNNNSFPVQLLRRKWIIQNGVGEVEVVEGDGVIGRQPILKPGENHEYISGAVLATPLGIMHGLYYFQNKLTDAVFEVNIPQFKLEATEILN
jgi:ApaG protein